VRTGPGAGFAEELRKAIAEVDPNQRVLRLRPMTALVSSITADSRFNAGCWGFLPDLRSC